MTKHPPQLPEPAFNPQWPKVGTMVDKALQMLLQGLSINVPDFQRQTKSWRLSAKICILRGLGWPIETLEILSPTDENPRRYIARYSLHGKYIALALAIRKAGGV